MPSSLPTSSGGTSLKNLTGTWVSKHPQINQKKCIKCHQCATFCPEGCIKIEPDGKNVKINPAYCKDCLICVNECPVKAIE